MPDRMTREKTDLGPSRRYHTTYTPHQTPQNNNTQEKQTPSSRQPIIDGEFQEKVTPRFDLIYV